MNIKIYFLNLVMKLLIILIHNFKKSYCITSSWNWPRCLVTENFKITKYVYEEVHYELAATPEMASSSLASIQRAGPYYP